MTQCCNTCIHFKACTQFAEMSGNRGLAAAMKGDSHKCKNYESCENFLKIPFPIGSTVYELVQAAVIWLRTVVGYHYNSEGKQKGLYIIVKCDCGLTTRINTSKVGVTLFDSKEEAEAGKEALKDWLVS